MLIFQRTNTCEMTTKVFGTQEPVANFLFKISKSVCTTDGKLRPFHCRCIPKKGYHTRFSAAAHLPISVTKKNKSQYVIADSRTVSNPFIFLIVIQMLHAN